MTEYHQREDILDEANSESEKDRLIISPADRNQESDPHETTHLVSIMGPLVKWSCLPLKYRAAFPANDSLPKVCRKTKKLRVTADEFAEVQRGHGSVHDPNITHSNQTEQPWIKTNDGFDFLKSECQAPTERQSADCPTGTTPPSSHNSRQCYDECGRPIPLRSCFRVDYRCVGNGDSAACPLEAMGYQCRNPLRRSTCFYYLRCTKPGQPNQACLNHIVSVGFCIQP